jgi:hypothetical protein
MTIKEECKMHGIAFKTYYNRRYNYGWSHQEALRTPVQKGQKKRWEKICVSKSGSAGSGT